MKRLLLASVIVLSMAAWGAAPATRPNESATTVTTTASYAARSSEAQRIVDWLVSRDAPAKDGPLANYADNGSFSVRIKTTRASGARQEAAGVRTGPLPANGQGGDVLEVTRSTDAVMETWTYPWQGGSSGGWELTQYEYHRKPSSTS